MECLKEGKQVNNCKIMGESTDIFVSERHYPPLSYPPGEILQDLAPPLMR